MAWRRCVRSAEVVKSRATCRHARRDAPPPADHGPAHHGPGDHGPAHHGPADHGPADPRISIPAQARPRRHAATASCRHARRVEAARERVTCLNSHRPPARAGRAREGRDDERAAGGTAPTLPSRPGRPGNGGRRRAVSDAAGRRRDGPARLSFNSPRQAPPRQGRPACPRLVAPDNGPGLGPVRLLARSYSPQERLALERSGSPWRGAARGGSCSGSPAAAPAPPPQPTPNPAAAAAPSAVSSARGAGRAETRGAGPPEQQARRMLGSQGPGGDWSSRAAGP